MTYFTVNALQFLEGQEKLNFAKCYDLTRSGAADRWKNPHGIPLNE